MVSRPLGRRSWLWARGFPLILAALTVAGVVGVLSWTSTQPRRVQMLAIVGVLAAGAVCLVVGRTVFGTASVRRRVMAERRRWARERGWDYVGDLPAADPALVGLVLPRGWREPRVVAAVRGTLRGRRATVETWELHAAVGSTRQTTYREIVAVGAATRGHRCAVVDAAQVDPLLLQPAWVDLHKRPRDGGERLHADGDPLVLDTWGPTFKRAVAGGDDLPSTVAAGMDRVVVMAFDDARTTTAETRLELAGSIADIIDPLPRSR